MPESDKVLGAYYRLTGLFSLAVSLSWGVHVLFLIESGLKLEWIFFVFAVFSGSVAALEVPAGIAADVLGRRSAFLAGVVVLASGTFLYMVFGLVHGGAAMFALLSAYLGLGTALVSGVVEAWAVDALRETGNPHPLDYVFSQAALVSGAALLAGTVLGGLLGALHLSLPFFARAALLAAAGIYAKRHMHDRGFSPKSLGIKELPSELRKAARAGVFFGWNEVQVRWLIVAAAVQAVFVAWGYHAWQPYLLGMLEDGSPWYAGLIAAAIVAASMAGNAAVARLERFCGRRTTLLLCAASVFAVAVIGVGAATVFWGAVAYYLLAMGALGVFEPVRQAYLHGVTPSEYRATVASFDSLVTGGVGMLGQGSLGAAARMRSLDFGYAAGGFSSLFALPALLMLRRLEGRGDEIPRRTLREASRAAVGHPLPDAF